MLIHRRCRGIGVRLDHLRFSKLVQVLEELFLFLVSQAQYISFEDFSNRMLFLETQFLLIFLATQFLPLKTLFSPLTDTILLPVGKKLQNYSVA